MNRTARVSHAVLLIIAMLLLVGSVFLVDAGIEKFAPQLTETQKTQLGVLIGIAVTAMFGAGAAFAMSIRRLPDEAQSCDEDSSLVYHRELDSHGRSQ